MTVLATILPVFFMLGLGLVSRSRGWLQEEQSQGIAYVLNTLLFPIMVFNAMFVSKIESSALGIIAFFFVLHLLALYVGKLTGRFVSGRYAHISRFLMATVDGGNVCYPLYASLVGSQFIGNIVLMDIAGIFIIFLVIPLLLSSEQAGANETSWTDNLKKVLKNPVVIALTLGLLLNLLALPKLLASWQLDSVYTNVTSMAIAPIVPLILFNIGFLFKVDKGSLTPLIKSVLSRILIMGAGLAAFLFLFPDLRANHEFYLAALLYFMSPPALVMPSLLTPVFKDEDEKSFASAFTSVYMLVTLTVFILLTFIA